MDCHAFQARNDAHAFTLAEVLITLVIIGIIAAITVPTLITKYQKEQTVTKLKKSYSVLQQAINKSIAQNGAISSWNFPSGWTQYSDNPDFFNKYFVKYLNIQKTYLEQVNKLNGESQLGVIWIQLNDGQSIGFISNYPRYFWIFIDINGNKKPNRLGKDIFHLWLGSKKSYGNIDNINFELLFASFYTPTNYLLTNNSDYNCNKNSNVGYQGSGCGAIIQRNGWKIPDDYPW